MTSANTKVAPMVNRTRKGESEAPRFRSDRTIAINGRWFFQVRETMKPVGPFLTKGEALKNMTTYIGCMRAAVPFERAVKQLTFHDDAVA